MSFLTTALLCIMCFILSFRVTNQQRSLTDIMCMGKRYRRHNKIMAAGALEVIKTDSGHLALKVDTQGSKDFVAIRLSRKEAKHFKAVLAACDGEPLNVSVCQYKVGGKKYFILYDKNADKKVPIELNGPKEETVKSNCKTVRSAAFAIFIFSPLLHTISPAISIVMILTATILVLLNIPFLPNSEWEKMCEFIKRPQTVQQSSEVNTDIVQSAASIALQEIMDKYQFKDLPQYKNGVKIDYTLQEANSNPYTYEIVKGSDGYSFTITNNYVPAAVNVPVTTVWDDDDNRDGIRAKETAITLQGSNGKVYQRIVTGKDDFATVFEDVPKFFDEGREVVYTVTQNEMNGYTTNIANTDKYTFQITNTHEPERLAKTVTKVWDDNNNQDGLRPNTLRIALTGTDGTYIEKSLSTANNWTEAFDGLYKYFKEGTPIQYTIDEEMVGGYEKEISEKDNLITITNIHAPEKLDLIVNVVWNDANNQDGYRPDAATIHMSGTDGTQDTKDFTKDSSWSSIVFKDLDHYKNGNEIKYTVTEDEIPQYTTSIAVNGNVVTVTNTHIPEITLRNISVVWEDNNDQDGLRPDTVSVKLKGNDKFIDSSEVNEDVKWKHSFTKLPVRENGNEISYTAEENEIPGYTTTIEKTDTGYVFTNTHIPETVTVTVDKVWDDSENQDGLRPDTIHIKLVSNGIAKDAYLDADSNWHLEFEGLPKYRDHGILNEYSVQEVDVDGYTSTVTTEDGYAFTIKNDHVPAVIDIPITEEWIDDNNRDGLRPSSHTVILTDGINTIEEIVLDKDNGYGTVLKDMPKYKNGVEIDYQIKDFKVDGYTTNIIKGDSVKDFKVTNTHVPEMVTVTVTEGWHDQSDYDKIRPEEIALTLTGSDGNV